MNARLGFFDCENGSSQPCQNRAEVRVIVTISLDRIRLYTGNLIYNTPRANNFNQVKSQF